MPILQARPKFWDRIGLLNILLSPLALLWWLGYNLKYMLSRPYKASIPVVCVGNINVGGSGKTPTTIALAKAIQSRGKKVAILTRGYGKRHSSSLVITVNQQHTAYEVGDEALLLYQAAPTYICADRGLAARSATADGAEILLMDDGMQNNSIHKDYTIMMITNNNQFGNGMLMPAGPMRETFANGRKKADVFLLLNITEAEMHPKLLGSKPGYIAKFSVTNPQDVCGKRCVAICAIANPEQFWHSLQTAQVDLVGKFAYPDHHIFREQELEKVFAIAQRLQAQVVTTSKDIVKFPENYRSRAIVLEVSVVLPDELIDVVMMLR